MITDKKYILEFLTNQKANHKGYIYNDLIEFSNKKMEECHDHIQWMFPTNQPSKFASKFPIITVDFVNYLKRNQETYNIVCMNMIKALERMEGFYNLYKYQNHEIVDNIKDFYYFSKNNHNLLRITRIIRSLRLFELDEFSCRFYSRVMEVFKLFLNHFEKEFCQYGTEINLFKEPLEYWNKAYYEDKWSIIQ